MRTGATMGTVLLLVFFLLLLLLLLQPGRATADPRPSDAIQDVEQGEWISVHDQRWRLTSSVRTASMPWSVLAPAGSASVYVAHVGVGKRGEDNVWRYRRDDLTRAARSNFDGHGVELGGDRIRLNTGKSTRGVAVSADGTLGVAARGSHELLVFEVSSTAQP